MAFTSFPIPTRLLTLPTGDVVGTTDTQTLTNKTLTSPVINGTVTGTALADQATMEAGTVDNELATPLGVAQAITAQVPDLFNATGAAPLYACRAWVNFNGTGTVAIRASGNVSSITDNGTGDYTVNFTTAMPDANYAVSGSVRVSPATSPRALAPSTDTAPQTTSVRVITGVSGGALADGVDVSVAIFR